MPRALWMMVMFPFTAIAAAQQPGIELKLDARTLEPGEAVDIQLVCTNTGMPGTPQAVLPNGLQLEVVNATPSVFSQRSYVNGQWSQSNTYTYALRLTALRAGTYTLGPVSVTADGKNYQTNPMTIDVRASEISSRPQGDRYLFAEIAVEPTSLYVSQTYKATLTIGIRKVEINGRLVDMELLRIVDGNASQLSIFPRSGWTTSEVLLPDSAGQQHRYALFRVAPTVRAEEVGETLVGPVFLKANYPTAVRQGIFGQEVSRSRPETARAEAVRVEVKSPPETGRPADFTGAIGQYTLSVDARPTRVEQGQPITLTISIRGLPLEGIAGPNLSRQPELASRFDFSRDELTGDMETGAKVFRQAIFPKQQGDQTIPVLIWSFFDPVRASYQTLKSSPVPIIVEPPTANAATLSLIKGQPPADESTQLIALPGGISPNYIDADAALTDQRFRLTFLSILILGAAPSTFLMALLTLRHRERLRGDKSFARRRRALRNADALIRRAQNDGQPDDQLQSLAKALTEYVADRFDLPAEALTAEEVRSALASRLTDQSIIHEVHDFLEMCDAARYAPQGYTSASALKAATDVGGWIRRIEKTAR